MRFRVFLVVCTLVFLPIVTQSEVLYLKDGSTIQGKLKRLVNDTLYFETSFGSSIRVPRAQVARIDFADAPLVQPPAAGAAAVGVQSSVPGTVMVSFDKVKLSSKVSVERGKDEAAILCANRIECALYMGSDKVYSQIDSVTDKTIREGPETRFRNDMVPQDFKVAVPPGSYQCRFFIGNVVPEGYEQRFVGDPLDKRLLVENVEVLPARTTQLRIGVKRKMKIGTPQLFVFD
jgi:hypothetical protein